MLLKIQLKHLNILDMTTDIVFTKGFQSVFGQSHFSVPGVVGCGRGW